MSLTMEAVTKHYLLAAPIKKLYGEAFPANERAPLSLLYRKARRPYVDFTAYYDGISGSRTFVGFAYLVRSEDLVFLMYLAIDPRHRSKGYGSRVLEQIRLTYPGCRIMLNIEAPDSKASNAGERLRRREFYVRSGYAGSGFLIKEFGVLYEALIQGGTFEREEFNRLYRRFMGFPLSLLARLKIFPKPDGHPTIGESGT